MMKYGIITILSFIIIFDAHQIAVGQHIFAARKMDYKKEFFSYDLPNVYGMEDDEFVLFQQEKKNSFRLSRYDEYFFDKWSREISFSKKEGIPQLVVKGDSLIIINYTVDHKKQVVQLSYQIYNAKTGDQIDHGEHNLIEGLKNDENPRITFSGDCMKFAIHHINNENQSECRIYNLAGSEPVKTINFDRSSIDESKTTRFYLDNNGDLFMVSIDPAAFRMETSFWDHSGDERVDVQNNFFFERPPDKIGSVQIQRISPSSFYVAFTADIEKELIGYGICGVNVVLKNVLFSNNTNFSQEDISQLYQDYWITSDQQRKKDLEVPKTLDDFRLVTSILGPQKNILLFFEQLEKPTYFHAMPVDHYLPWKVNEKEDKYFYGGDLFISSVSPEGNVNWTRMIQKTQHSKSDPMALSFIPRIEADSLRILTWDDRKKGNFYIIGMNLQDGSQTEHINLIPDKKYEFVKSYSGWINHNFVMICAISPFNSNKRMLYLMDLNGAR